MGMLGVVLGVAVGALLYFLIQVPTLVSLGSVPRITRRIDWRMIREVVMSSLPRTLGSSLSNITFMMMSAIASFLAVGSISVFQFSYNIENTPLLIVGVSYAVAAFPAMAKLFAEHDRDGFIDVLYRATRNIFFLSIPTSFFIIVLRAHVVRILLGAGVFSWNDTRLVAATVALFSVSVVAQAMVLLLVRAFFAVGNTKKPLLINVYALGVTACSAVGLLCAYTFWPTFHDMVGDLLRIDGVTGTSVIMLAGAFSAGQLFNAAALWYSFHRHFYHNEGTLARAYCGVYRAIAHMIGAGIVASAAVYGALQALGPNIDQHHFFGILLQALISGTAGAIVYGGILLLCGNDDIAALIATVRSRFWKVAPVVQGQQDL